ncbi:Clr5 domain-containing protein [Diplogelasinospora grovesii]|uniref:Clr5 domain-containing protein n=1 Tax=Diplogelasinospora grovesii TaxID=303347 RepID=A0AAN6RZB4_9PEZI|nr:Clr5 domain-containing protein [Diplogelasinospora grovesii]
MPTKKVAAKAPPQEDWDRHRSTITRLYYDEKKHLEEVMAIMESEYRFSATDKMYKTKFKKWGLKKNISEPEAVCIYRMKRKRDAVGKNSEFFIRGRRWDEDPQQHLSRKTGLLRQLEQENADDYDDIDGSAAALGIVCRTPSPEPVQPQSRYQHQHQQHQQTVSYQPNPSDVSLMSPTFTDGALPSPSATALTSDSGRTVDWSMVNPWAPYAADDVQASGSYRYPDLPDENGTDHQQYPSHGPAGLSDGYASWGDGAQWDGRQ